MNFSDIFAKAKLFHDNGKDIFEFFRLADKFEYSNFLRI